MKSGFDIASNHYDSSFTFSRIGKAQRKFVYNHIDSIVNINKKLSILEINCGTGEDAIYLSKLGHDVIATDVSESMIRIAKSKNTLSNLTFEVLDINAISKDSFNRKFDLIFSNFGGLNCLSKPELSAFLDTSAHLLNPNAKLIMVLMPKHCIWEQLYFGIKGNLKKAKRRYTDKYLLVNVNNVSVKTWYYNPKEIISLTKKLFTPKKIKPVGIAIPPSYFENSFLAKKPFLNGLRIIEKLLSQSFWAKYADHFLIELIKK